MERLTRRKAVLGTLGLGAVALAGCVSEGNGDAGEGGDDDDVDGSDLTSSIERTGSDCAGPDPGEVSVVEEEGVYTVEGTLPSPTPCYEPVLESVEFEEEVLSLAVGVVEEEIEGECVTCSGKVLYEATVEGVAGQADRVEVTHPSETYTVESSEFGSSRPELVDAELPESSGDSRTEDFRSEIDLGEITPGEDDAPGTLELAGKIPTNTPHYEAVLEDATIRGTEIDVTVGVESTLDDGEMGTTELGAVTYTAVFEVRNVEAVDSLRVEHPESTHGLAWESASESAEGTASEGGTRGSSSGSRDADSGSGRDE